MSDPVFGERFNIVTQDDDAALITMPARVSTVSPQEAQAIATELQRAAYARTHTTAGVVLSGAESVTVRRRPPQS